MVINAERTMDKEMSAESHAQLESVCKNQESSSSEEEDDVQPVVNMPPTHFSNINVQSSANVHFGTVYNGDVTVIVSPGVNGQVGAPSVKRVLAKTNENVKVTSGERNNLDNSEKENLAFMTAGILNSSEVHQTFNKQTAELSKTPKYSPKKMALFGLKMVIIIGLIVPFIVWRLKLSSSSSSDYYPDYDPTGNHINGTDGSTPYYRRVDWNATPANETQPLHHPVVYYIISQSNTPQCFNKTQCLQEVHKIQRTQKENLAFSDIGYNFLVGGEGGVYEGRGWENVGAHAKGYNVVSIGIDMIGNFGNDVPGKRQLKGLKILMEEGVRLGKVDPAYKLIAHRQVSATESPGYAFYLVLQKWPHFFPLRVED